MDHSFTAFSLLSIDDVISAVRQLLGKSSAADAILTNVLKQVADLVAPFVVELFNRSLSAGHFPKVFRHAFVTPVVKKQGLDATDVSSLSSDIELIGFIEAPGAPRSSQAAQLFDDR